MKLRLRENSLRLRLQQKEVSMLIHEGYVTEIVQFGPLDLDRLVYTVECSSEVATLEASIDKNIVRILVPQLMANQWADSAAVSLSHEQRLPKEKTLKILIEKDFKCISPNRIWSEDESDAFPNPNPSCGGKAQT